jgi:hypothetical protein
VFAPGVPALAPRYGDAQVGCCAAETVAVGGRHFGACGGVDFLDDDGELGARALGLLLQERTIDLGKNRVSREKDARLERLEKELPWLSRGIALAQAAPRARKDRGCARRTSAIGARDQVLRIRALLFEKTPSFESGSCRYSSVPWWIE